jgi:hypothetical protein
MKVAETRRRAAAIMVDIGVVVVVVATPFGER